MEKPPIPVDSVHNRLRAASIDAVAEVEEIGVETIQKLERDEHEATRLRCLADNQLESSAL